MIIHYLYNPNFIIITPAPLHIADNHIKITIHATAKEFNRITDLFSFQINF